MFKVQADVAGQVAQALDVALGTPQRQALAEQPTANAAAYDAYLKGEAASRNLGTGDPLELREAIGYYEQAVALDSGFAQAWSALSRASSLLYFNGTPSPERAQRAREAADRALRLSPNHFRGHLALGDYYGAIPPLDYERALREYEAGLRLAPNDIDLLASSALMEISTGRWEEALRAPDAGTGARSPVTAGGTATRATRYLRLRRYPEAHRRLRPRARPRSRQRHGPREQGHGLSGPGRPRGRASADPGGDGDHPAHLARLVLRELLRPLLGAAGRAAGAAAPAHPQRVRRPRLLGHRAGPDLSRAGRPGAVARSMPTRPALAFQERLRGAPDDAQSHVILGLALAYLGRKAEAVAEGEKGVALLPIAADAYSGPYVQHQLVRIYLLVGEPEKALDRLEPLLRIPYYLSPGWLRIDPEFDPLRKHPRFQRLVGGTT